MAIKCDPKYLENFRKQAKKENYDPDKLTDLEKRIRRLNSIADFNRSKYADDVAKRVARERTMNDYEFAQNLGQVFNLRGAKYNAVEDWLTNFIGIKFNGVLGIKPSATESVKANLVNASRIASGFIDEVARFRGMKQVQQHTKNIKAILKKAGITDKADIGEILVDSIEVGTMPNYQASFNIGEAGKAYMNGKYRQFENDLLKRGLTQEDVDTITESAYKISAMMDEVRITANSLGLDVGKVENIGYFTRVFVPEVNRFIDLKNRTGQAFSNLMDSGLGFSLNTKVQNSRSTFKLIPEDLEIISELGGVSLDELSESINTNTLTKLLHEKFSAAALEELVDTGILSKVPMTSREVADYMVSQFPDLPYKGMSDIFLTDPEKVFDFYIENLQNSAKASTMAKTMIREGMDNGWTVTKEMFTANPEKYKDYVELKAKIIKEYFPQYKGTESLYTHKIAQNTWEATLAVAGDPRFMNAFSQHVNYWGSLFSKAMLIHPAYASRILWDSARAMVSSGANFSRSFEGMFDVAKLWQGGLDVLDDTKKIYTGLNGQKISERELMRHFIRMRGSGLVPGVANVRTGNATQAIKDLFDLKQMGKSIGYTMTYMKNFGGVEAGKYILDGIKGKQADLFAPIASIANFFEIGMKWATIKSLADDGDQIGAFFLGGIDKKPTFTDVREIFNHVDDYFLAWDDVGGLSKTLGAVQPFAAFSMANPPAQVRQAMRRPREFMNYYRIKQFMLDGGDTDDEDLNEATVPHWMRQASPLTFKKVEDGKYITLLSSAFDARASAFEFIHESTEALSRDMGWWTGTNDEAREKIENDMNGRSALFRMFSDNMARSHTMWQNVAEMATGVDVTTGREIERKSLFARDSFLGVNMPTGMRYLLSSYPILSRIDRANPFGVFGEPSIVDPTTGEVLNESKPSIFGASRGDSNRIEKYAAGQLKPLIQTASYLGLDFRIIDTARNLQWTTSDVKRVRDELNSTLKRSREELTLQKAKNGEDAEYYRRIAEYNDQVERLVYMEYEYQQLIKYMAAKKIPPKNFFQDLEKEAVREYINNQGSTPVDDVLIDSIEKYKPLFVGE